MNLLLFIEGLSISWVAPNEQLLRSEDTPLESGPMSETEVSWIAALSCLGGVISTCICGLLLESIGRKGTLILTGVPACIGWLCILLARDGLALQIGRVLCGCAGSLSFMAVPVFVSEITDDRHRGQLGSVLSLSCNFGILSGFLVTSITGYYTLPCLIEGILLIYFAMIFFVADSPRYLRSKKRYQAADKAHNFYIDPLPDLELKELEKEALNPVHDTTTVRLADFKRPEYWKPILIALIGAPFTASSGIHTIITYTKQIFDKTGSEVPSEVSMVIIALVQLLGSYISTTVIERTGRKTLLFWSSLGCGLCLMTTGLFYHLMSIGVDTSSFSALPLVSLSLLFLIFAVGLASVPYVIITEILPQRVKGLIYTFCQLEILLVLILSARVSCPPPNSFAE